MNKIKKYVIIFTLVFILFATTKVNADSFKVTPGGGGAPPSSGCPNCSWVYSSTGLGIRLSLYKYDGKKLEFKASVDLVNQPSSYPTTVNTTTKKVGRYNYTVLKESLDFKYTSINAKDINDYGFSTIDEESNYSKKFSQEVVDYFGDTEAKIINKIKTMFGITVTSSEFSKYYLVAEPTAFLYSRSGGFYTYATGYEYMRVLDELNKYQGGYAWNLWESQGRVTFLGYMFNGMYNETNSNFQYMLNGTKDGRYDYYNFLNQYSGKGALVRTASSRMASKSEIINNNAYAKNDFPYGVLVFWLGEKGKLGCSATCSGKSGDDLLKCAENYCSSNSSIKTTEEKEKCILNECKYTYTKLSCGISTKSNGGNTECAATTSSNKKSCEIVSTPNYSYKVECTTNSTVTFPETLPSTVLAGQGFEYRVRLYGNKTCTATFDSALWKFNYASSYSDAERQNYLTAITEFNKISLSNYFYDSSTANMSIKINERKNGNVETVTKKLTSEENYAQGDKKVTTTKTTKEIKSFHNNSTITKKVYVYKTDSSNSTYYELPGVCISAVDNLTVTEGSTCDNGLGPYNKYYTDVYTDATTNNVEVTVEQNSSGLDVENKCNYTVTDEPLSCYITTETASNQKGNILENYEDIKFVLNTVTPDRNRTIRYNLGTETKKISDQFNNKNVYTITKNSVSGTKLLTIYGTITDGKNIATCKKEVTINPQTCEWVKTQNTTTNETTLKIKSVSDRNAKYYIRNSTSSEWMNIQQRTISNDTVISLEGKVVLSNGDTYYCNYQNIPTDKKCKELYKPAEYSKIKDYCSKHWNEDADNYSSADDCYASCTGGNSCKQKYTCSEISNIRQYCKVNYQVDGYKNIGDCINDCTCDVGGVDYYYRTITLNNPFPQRDAHYNWLGYEEYITDDDDDLTPSTGNVPEYEIVLDSKRIEAIKSDTKRYNSISGNDAYGDYVRENDTDTGKYNSKFIHYDDTKDGGFKSYFTYIEGIKTS